MHRGEMSGGINPMHLLPMKTSENALSHPYQYPQ